MLHPPIYLIFLADEIIKSLNKTVDPCDNFYDFACGGFTNSPFNNLSANFINNIDDNSMEEKLKIVVTEPIKPNDLKCANHFKKFYESCKNTSKYNINN